MGSFSLRVKPVLSVAERSRRGQDEGKDDVLHLISSPSPSPGGRRNDAKPANLNNRASGVVQAQLVMRKLRRGIYARH